MHFPGLTYYQSCHSASSLFYTVFVFQKSYTGNILGIGQNKSQTSQYLTKLPEDRRGDGEGPGASLTTRGHSPAPGCAALWWGPPGPPLTLPLAYKDPPTGKPKHPINFPETHRDLPPSSTRDREGPEALPGTLPERGIATEGLLHRHTCLRRDEWVVYLGLWVHSSS
jgi:hypothetical protein